MVDFVKLKDSGEESDIKEKRKSKISFKKILLIALFFFFLSSIITSLTYEFSPKLAVVPIKGPILTEKTSTLYGSSISSRDISNTLRELMDDDSVKAVLLDINSPGGSPVASEEISNAIEELKIKKSVYALINDVGASGAFWIAVSADKIYSSSMSTVGSIGVTSAGLSFENFIKEYNISYRKLTAGKYKDMGSIFRKPTENESKLIQNILNEVHENFISHVAKNRNLTYSQVKKYATGEIFLGSKAKEIGFIDEIGYYPNVISDLKKKVNNDDLMIVSYEEDPTLLEVLGVDALTNIFPKTLVSLQ